jgi:hypothetical protein
MYLLFERFIMKNEEALKENKNEPGYPHEIKLGKISCS